MNAGLPGVVRHTDWSVSRAKRWVAEAVRAGDMYLLDAPCPVTDPTALLHAEAATVLLGLDVVVGLPEHYAARAGITDFRSWLGGLDGERWQEWSQPAGSIGEVTLRRPFFPSRPGGASQPAFAAAHGAVTFDDLRRTCERRPPLRRPACPLFWTLGANQVGRATLHAWQTVVRPALADASCGIWPFDGALDALLTSRRAVIAETYPAEMAALVRVPTLAKRDVRRARRRGPGAPLRRVRAWACGSPRRPGTPSTTGSRATTPSTRR